MWFFPKKAEQPLKGLLFPAGQIDGNNHKKMSQTWTENLKKKTSHRYTVNTMGVYIGSKRRTLI